MNWTTGPVTPPKPLSAVAQQAATAYGGPLGVVAQWRIAKAALDKAAVVERELRLAAFELMFADPKEGTNRVALTDGWSLKATYPYSYKVSNKESKAEQAIDAMAEISQQAGFIADRLIKWEPDLAIKEYRLLNPDNPAAQTDEQKKILALLTPILTITPGMPQFEIEPPKGK